MQVGLSHRWQIRHRVKSTHNQLIGRRLVGYNTSGALTHHPRKFDPRLKINGWGVGENPVDIVLTVARVRLKNPYFGGCLHRLWISHVLYDTSRRQ